MIIRNRLIETELVEQMTLLVVLASHHCSPPTQNVVTRRNHRSPKPSNHFCNKIGSQPTWKLHPRMPAFGAKSDIVGFSPATRECRLRVQSIRKYGRRSECPPAAVLRRRQASERSS